LTFLEAYDELLKIERKIKVILPINRKKRAHNAIIAAAASAAGRLAVLLGEDLSISLKN